MFRRGLLLLAVAAALVALPAAARAQVWTEVGDAGNSAATAQTIQSPTLPTLTTINGTISNKDDFDAYRFRITAPATFSVNTRLTGAGDTMVYLFRNDGT